MSTTFAACKAWSLGAARSVILTLLLWVLLLTFAPLPPYLAPQFWLIDPTFTYYALARLGIASFVALAALTTLWVRRLVLDNLLMGSMALALLAVFSALHDNTITALMAATWWLVFFAAYYLTPHGRSILLQFCLFAYGAQVLATLGAYFFKYEPFITPRFGARAGGMAGSPNQIYPWSLIWAALFWAATHRAPSVAAKRWLRAGALGSVAVLLLTFSRAGWIGLAAVLPFVWPRSQSRIIRIAPWAIAAILLLGAATIRTRGEILSTENDGSTRGRALLYRVSWRLFQEKPLLGHGVGQIARRNDLEVDFIEPKNIYAQFALEHGIVGLVLFAVFVTGVLQRARHVLATPNSDATLQWVARTLLLALPALLVAGLFDTPLFGHFERIVPTVAFLVLVGVLAGESPLEADDVVASGPLVEPLKVQHDPDMVEVALRDLDAAMTENGVDYYVIGSCARLAYLEDLTPVSDIDILIFGAQHRRRALPILQLVSKRSGVLVDDSLSRFFEIKNGAHFLVYGPLRVPVEACVFEKRMVAWQNAMLPTFAPQTLLHFFNCLVATPLRAKDKPNVYRFARFVRSRREFDHVFYLPFHFFVERWRYFPLRRLQLGWRLLLQKFSPTIRHKILQSYQTAPSRLLRGAFNFLVPFVFLPTSARLPKRSRQSRRRLQAFSLTEILVVIGVVALLAALLLPAVARVREGGRRTVCTSLMADFGRAFHLYAQDYDGFLPNPGGRGLQKNGNLPAVDAGDNGAAWYSPGQVVNPNVIDRGGLLYYMGRLQKDPNNQWACPNAMDASPVNGDTTRAIGQSYTMNDYLRSGHPGADVIRQEDAPAAFNPSYHTGIALSQVGAGDGHSGADVILLYEAVQRNSGSVNRNGSPYWGRDWLSRYGMNDLPQGAPEEYHMGLSNFLFCDGHVKALRPVMTWTSATQAQIAALNPSYAHARGGRNGEGSIDNWNPRLTQVHYP